MHRRMDTRRIPAGAKTRTKNGVEQVQLNIWGVPTWCEVTTGNRARVIRPEWYGSVRMADGSIKTVRLVKDRQSAESLLAKLQLKQDRISAGLEVVESETSEEFAQLLERYWESRAREAGSEYLFRQQTRLNSILSEMGVGNLDRCKTMTKTQIEGWIKKKGCSSGTINQYLIPLEMFLKWLRVEKLIARVPELPKIRVRPTTIRRALTACEVARLEASSPWPRSLFYSLAFHTLARKSALLALKVSDLHLDDPAGPWLMLQRQTSKTNHQQQVPIPTRLVPMLKRLVRESRGRPLFWQMQGQDLSRRWFMDDLPAAGIPRVTDEGVAVIHSLRHGGATELLKRGVSVLLVQKLGGWKSTQMLQNNYAHLSPVQQRSEIDRAFQKPS